MLQEQALLERARMVLGVGDVNEQNGIENGENRLRYAYYRRMFQYHPDRNGGDPHAHRKAALINEAFEFLAGKRHSGLLLKEDLLVSMMTNSVVTELEGVLSYDEWHLQRFYNTEEKSIWAY